MGKDYTPFKMKGFSGFGNSPMTKKSPAKDDPEATHPEHHKVEEVEPKKVETEAVDPDEYEKILLKQSDEGKEPLTGQEETILGKYRSRMFKEGGGE